MTPTTLPDAPVDETTQAERTETPSRSSSLPIVALGVLALLLVAVGVAFVVQTVRLNHDGSRANSAVVDQSTTSAVVSQVSSGLSQVLSYDYQHPQNNAAAAKRWLTGDAPKQYDLLLKQLLTIAKGQNLTTTATVSDAGVTSIDGDTAQLLVFVNEQSTRASDNATTASPAQVQITAKNTDGSWRISELRPLG